MYQHKLNGFSNYRCYDRRFAGIHSAILSIRRDERFQEQRPRTFLCRSFVMSSFSLFMLSLRLLPFCPLTRERKRMREKEREREREKENNARVSNA